MPDNQKGSLRVRVCAMKRVRVRYHHPIHIMDVSERSDTCLVHDKQYQQAQCTYNFFLLLHVQKLTLYILSRIDIELFFNFAKQELIITLGSRSRPLFGNKLPLIQRTRFNHLLLLNVLHQIIA